MLQKFHKFRLKIVKKKKNDVKANIQKILLIMEKIFYFLSGSSKNLIISRVNDYRPNTHTNTHKCEFFLRGFCCRQNISQRNDPSRERAS